MLSLAALSLDLRNGYRQAADGRHGFVFPLSNLAADGAHRYGTDPAVACVNIKSLQS